MIYLERFPDEECSYIEDLCDLADSGRTWIGFTSLAWAAAKDDAIMLASGALPSELVN